MGKRDLLALTDLSGAEIDLILKRAVELKGLWKSGQGVYPFSGKCLGLIFDKASTRTRVSFEVGIGQLGGRSIYLDPSTTQIKRGEPIADSARVLSRYLDGLIIRTFDQSLIEEWGRWSSIPVINGLTNLLHPCQILCDLQTIVEKKGAYRGLKIAYIGDGNNIANTWIQAAGLIDFSLAVACPKSYEPNADVVARAMRNAAGRVEISQDPFRAASGADVLYTDVWASMGQENEREERRKSFQGFQVNADLLARAKPGALVMHCLPAHLGEEITADVYEGPQSVVFDQAENRLYGQKAILEFLLQKS
jgi:ornithine carbamoyltransferase